MSKNEPLAELQRLVYCERVNVVVLQPDIVWEDKQANFAKVSLLLKAAAPEAGSLVVLPEMFATGFTMNADAVAESYGGETEQFLASIAGQYGVCVVAGAPMRGKDGKARNKALIFSPAGSLLAFYAKMKPFSPGMEGQHYKAGERPTVFSFAEWNIAPFICYDLRFPEIFRQATASRRPELFILIASWPAKRSKHWMPMLQSRAIENQAYVVAANRVGTDPYYSYEGQSMVIDPHGEVLANAGNLEGAIRARLDLPTLQQYRRGLPFLNDLKL